MTEPAAAPIHSRNTSSRPRVGVIGTGSLGKEHARIYADLDREGVITLAGVFDSNPENAQKIAAKQGTRCFASLAEASAECDALSVVTPTVTHHAIAKELLSRGVPILLPTDIVALEAGAAFGRGETEGEVRTVGADVPAGWAGLDIGPESVAAYAACLASAGTVLWNGPMGVFEDNRFAAGTAGVARAVADCAGYTVVGGGDSVAAIGELGLEDRIDFISTGGGASLELLEFGDLPGLAALRGAPNAPAGGSR